MRLGWNKNRQSILELVSSDFEWNISRLSMLSKISKKS